MYIFEWLAGTGVIDGEGSFKYIVCVPGPGRLLPCPPACPRKPAIAESRPSTLVRTYVFEVAQQNSCRRRRNASAMAMVFSHCFDSILVLKAEQQTMR